MPSDAPEVKRLATEGYGGELVLYDRDREDREEIGRRLARERALTLIPPYDHAHIIAGQGTATRELIEDIGPLDYLFVPCGGGGLLSGSAIAARALAPDCKVIGVEPAAGDDATRSFRSKRLQTVHNPKTVADGAAAFVPSATYVASGSSRMAVANAQLQDEAAHPRNGAPVTFLQINDVYSTLPIDGLGGLARVATLKQPLGRAGRMPFVVLA